jgi:hypothetical protein
MICDEDYTEMSNFSSWLNILIGMTAGLLLGIILKFLFQKINRKQKWITKAISWVNRAWIKLCNFCNRFERWIIVILTALFVFPLLLFVVESQAYASILFIISLLLGLFLFTTFIIHSRIKNIFIGDNKQKLPILHSNLPYAHFVKSLNQWKNRQTSYNLFLLGIALIFIIIFYFSCIFNQLTFNWPLLDTEIMVFLVAFFWFKVPAFKKIIGEDKQYRSIYRVEIAMVIMLLISIYTLFFITGELTDDKDKLTLISIGISVAGFLVSVLSSRLDMSDQIKQELISCTKKFVLSVILFLLFFSSLLITDKLGVIDINTPSLEKLSIARGLFFWFCAGCFYYASFLFSIAIIDIIWALRGIGSSTQERQ